VDASGGASGGDGVNRPGLDGGSPLSLSRSRARLSTGVADRQLSPAQVTSSSEGKWPRFIGDPCAAGSSQSRYCWWRGYLPRSGGEMTRLSIGGKSRKGVNRSQARSQVVTVWGYLTPMSDSEKSVRACQAASWFGAVQIGLESGRDLPAVPVGDEPHPGARNRVDHTGGDRGLGPGLPAFASGRPVSPSHSPARFALKREVPPLRSDTPRRCGCASSAHTSRPSRRLPPRARGPDT